MKKREFLISGVGAVAAGAALADASMPATGATAGGATPAAGRGLSRPPELQGAVGPQAWDAYVQDRFRVGSTAGEVELVLDEVRRRSVDATGSQFSLYFTSPGGAPELAPRTHVLRHATGQRVTVHMVPAGAGEPSRRLYRADFNQLA